MRKIILFTTIICFNQNLAYKVMHNGKDNVTDLVEYVLLNEDNPCARKCVKDAVPMTCRYSFNLEAFHTLSKACYDCSYNETDCYREDCISGDGHKRLVTVVNRKLPGPSIEVCLGDEVIIDVTNNLPTESTTIHWHGHHQRDNPYMDGVPFVTQCPITPGMTFRYSFNVRNAGTHFWHSHSGYQRTDGTFGPFIVRLPEEDDPHSNLYDYDLSTHSITILDWTKESSLDKVSSHLLNDGDNKPDTILVNGMGRFVQFEEDNETIYTPVARFTVEQGYRYRFRLINAGFLNCPIELSIDNHTMTVISSDGSDFNGTEVESLVSYAGERFDFILKADKDKDVYWMHFRGLMDCDERFTKAHQLAVLQYKDAKNKYPSWEPTYDNYRPTGKQLNPLNRGTEANNSSYVTMPQLHSLDKWDDSLKEKADFQYFVSYDFYKIDQPYYQKENVYGFFNITNATQQILTPQLNYISMKLQPFPLLSQRNQIKPDNMFCNETSVGNCQEEFCECTHVVRIPLDTVVEMVLIDKGYAYDANHPFHLHGHSFRVVAMERVGSHINVSDILKLDQNGKIQRNLVDPPIKDTVTVPDGGYTIIRFKATNPGYWIFHCHIELHVEMGMSVIFKIGEDYEMPAVPKDFPKCGNYIPSINSTNIDDCDEVSTFGAILKKLLPKIYKNYCPTNSASGTLPYNSIFAVMFMLLIRMFS